MPNPDTMNKPLSETNLPAWMALLERYRSPGAQNCVLKQTWNDVAVAYQLELDLVDIAGTEKPIRA